MGGRIGIVAPLNPLRCDYHQFNGVNEGPKDPSTICRPVPAFYGELTPVPFPKATGHRMAASSIGVKGLFVDFWLFNKQHTVQAHPCESFLGKRHGGCQDG